MKAKLDICARVILQNRSFRKVGHATSCLGWYTYQKGLSLFQAIEDSTGREDFVQHLRESILLSYGRRMAVTKLAKGDTSDRLAARAIAMASKGSGYALPSTLHFMDAR